MSRTIDETGNIYGNWTVLGRGHSKSEYNEALWLCECQCGIKRNISGASLRLGTSTSCGCNRRKFETSEPNFNIVFLSYVNNAKYKNREFCLSRELVQQLTSSNCHYCGTRPSTIMNRFPASVLPYLYNGIDRVDNSIGYIPDNVVPCCKTCNYMKASMAYKKFTEWLDRLVAYRLKTSK